MRVRLLAVLAVIVALAAAPVLLGAPTANTIEKQLRCVTCGTTLDVSNAPSAIQMKDRIAREIAAGMSEDAIIAGFVRDYGRTVLSNPPKSGLDLWLAWALPIGLPVLALFILPFVIRGWRMRTRAPAVVDALDDETRALVERELREHGDG